MIYFKILAYIFFGFIYIFLLNMVLTFIIFRFIKKKKLPKICSKPKCRTILQRILFDLPYQIISDKFNKSDYEFNESGFHLFVGEQGSGKTISLVYTLMQMQKQYPKLKVRTNMAYKYEDGEIKSWKNLVFSNNGVYGQIDVIDEVQNWFNSLQSKDFPPEMFSEITQQRKQRKCIFGTSQVWGRVAKPIREQVKYVYKPLTLFGCLTIIRKYKPNVDDEGSIDTLKLRSISFFIHNDEVRNAFDTYKKIQTQSLKGYKSEDKQIRKNSAYVSSKLFEED